MSIRIKEIRRIWLGPIKGALLHFNESDGWSMASHVAMSFMIAVFPFLIFTTSVAGFFSNKTESKGIIEMVFEYWPAEVAEPITREMSSVLNNGNEGFLTLGIVLALFFASNGVEAVRSALNLAYRDNDPRSLVKKRAQSLFRFGRCNTYNCDQRAAHFRAFVLFFRRGCANKHLYPFLSERK